jgi:two-component system, chemotaxis family, protein-glutamate methylesterase/glutaminase
VNPSDQNPASANFKRVLIVDDSSLHRRVLTTILEADPMLEVVGTAESGMRALELMPRLKPDVVTMDLRMPGMDGLETSEAIMRDFPTPIVMVTGSVSRDNQTLVAKAFALGLLAVIGKPNVNNELEADQLRRMVRDLANVRVVRRRFNVTASPAGAVGTRAFGSNVSSTQVINAKPASSGLIAPGLVGAGLATLNPAGFGVPRLPRRAKVIGIGASTGGPQALALILSRLPASFPVPILVVQHIAPGFAPSLVEWLSSECELSVQLAKDGSNLEPGIHIAFERHLIMREGKLGTSYEMPVGGHNPSATVLFKSLAQYGASAIGVILTGMGEDGALGLLEMRRAGALVIAQDDASAVVNSMPAAAAKLGAVQYRLDPDGIAHVLGAIQLETT